MKMTFRWYGKTDCIPLNYIKQIQGMSGVVTAVYDVPAGEVWPMESLIEQKKLCDENGLELEVIESIPVHEDIKLGRPTRDKYIAALKAAAGYVAEAETLFRRAWDAVSESRDQIIAYIRFTVACEAVRSFRAVGCEELAARWLSVADNQWNSHAFITFASAKPFREYLDGVGVFPGLRYWY